jgi:two-component system response regulator YesN
LGIEKVAMHGGWLSDSVQPSPKTTDHRALEQRVIRALKTATIGEVASAVELYCTALGSRCASVEDSYYYVHRLLALLGLACEEMGLSEGEILDDPARPFRIIYTLKSLPEISHWLKAQCAAIMTALNSKKLRLGERKSWEAVQYIMAHYADPSLSLTTLCSTLHISPSYLYRIFRERTGRTFLEFLTSVRLEQAMALLKSTTLKLAAIARQVGYSDEHYFSYVFKKATGISPTRYREAPGCDFRALRADGPAVPQAPAPARLRRMPAFSRRGRNSKQPGKISAFLAGEAS